MAADFKFSSFSLAMRAVATFKFNSAARFKFSAFFARLRPLLKRSALFIGA